MATTSWKPRTLTVDGIKMSHVVGEVEVCFKPGQPATVTLTIPCADVTADADGNLIVKTHGFKREESAK